MNKKGLTKVQVVVLLLVVLAAIASISATFVFYHNSATSNNDPLTIVDQDGRTVQVPANVQRVVIINSYWAEITCCLGDANKIVGIGSDVQTSAYVPSSVKNLTCVGDLFDGINMETLVALKPDLVIMDYGYGDAPQVVSQLESLNIPVITLSPANYNDEMGAVKIIGEALGSNQQADTLISYMQSGLTNITQIASQIPNSAKPTVFIGDLSVWDQGIIYAYSNSSWGNAVDLVGGINVALQMAPTQSYYQIDPETLLAWNPNIIIIVAYDNATLNSELASLNQNGTWASLQAVKDGHVYAVLVGGEQAGAYLDDGPRAMIGLMQLADIIQPQYFNINVQNVANQLFNQFYQFNST
jgi:ABC-type Fe3+-hydroxamate transport system substrate-binding protein